MFTNGTPGLASVIVVNHNRVNLLRSCLASVAEQGYSNLETIVVDNGSTDDSLRMVKSEFPTVILKLLPSNQGFARANNVGFRLSSAEFLVTLNNDTVVRPDFIEKLVAPAAADDRLGSVASLMIFSDRPQMVNSAGISVDRMGIAWDRLGGRPVGEAQVVTSVFGACGGAALYRRRMLADVGAFDEAYHSYLEDVDLAWRAKLRGWKCQYQPAAIAWHRHSATAGEHSPRKRFLLSRNKVRLLAKNYPTPDFLVYLPQIVAYDLAITLAGTLVGGVKLPIRSRLATLAGRAAGLVQLPEALRARSAVQATRTISSGEALALLEPTPTPAGILQRYRHLFFDSRVDPAAGT